MTPERPRDALGRPLPWDSDPGLAAPAVPDVSGMTDQAVWSLALDLLDRGMPFHAHEVFEERWRTCREDDRAAWRAAAQWGAARTHAARGNSVGAARLALRAIETLDSAVSIPTGIDTEHLMTNCQTLMEPPKDGPRVAPDR